VEMGAGMVAGMGAATVAARVVAMVAVMAAARAAATVAVMVAATVAGRCARASVPANMSMQCTSSGGATCCKCASIARDHLSGLRARERAVMRLRSGDDRS